MSTTIRRRAALAGALAVTSVLGLSACGASGAGAAAVVGSDRVATTDVQTATTEINEALGRDGAVPATSVLSWLMLAPYTIPAAGEAGTVASATDACQLLVSAGAQGEASADACSADPFSGPTLLALRSYLSTGRTADSFPDAEAVEAWWGGLLDEAEADGIEVSPRFGAYTRTDVASSGSLDELMAVVGTATPNWIETDGATGEVPAPEPTQAPTQAP